MIIIDPKEMYKAALQYYLEKQGWGSEFSTAIKANISQATLNRIKLGKRSGKYETLTAIAKALDTTYEDMIALGRYLITGEKKENEVEIFRLLQMAKAVFESGDEEMSELLRQNIINIHNIIKKRSKNKYISKTKK